jgi:S1-C subfamily serine protease
MSSSYDPHEDWPTQPHPQAQWPASGGSPDPAGPGGSAGGWQYPGSQESGRPHPGSTGGSWQYPGPAAGAGWQYPAPAGAGWPYPGGPGWQYPGAPSRPPRRRGRILLAAGVAVAAAAAGSAWAAAAAGQSTLSTAAIAARTDPGLVDITSTLGDQNAVAKGTGMVLTSTGEVLTNNHVIAGATAITARDIGNGRTYRATVVGYSEGHDVAVLQLRGASGLATVSLGDSAKVGPGQKVVALGNAEGRGGTPAIATGRVTAVGSSITAVDDGDGVAEHLTGMIRTSAGIQPGDSGGPLVNKDGQVVGMDTAASTSSPGSGMTSTRADSSQSTTAFSVPINEALSVANQIAAHRSSASVHIGATAFLGVAVEPSDAQSPLSGSQSASGVVVEGAVPGTAAAQAGLGNGDVLTALGGHAIGSSSELRSALEGYHPGDRVSISWTDQAGQTHTATVVLTAGPAG